MFLKESAKRLECEHYQRRCDGKSPVLTRYCFYCTGVLKRAPCCQKLYTCRFCHDDYESHKIDRTAITNIICTVCCKMQKVQRSCEGCGTEFGKYFCAKCRLYDDEEKGQFHCEKCGLCRIGGKQNFFHCDTCDCCLSEQLRNTHQCQEQLSRRDCPLCFRDMHTSHTNMHVLPCGHLVHRGCFEQCLKTGNYSCPTCGHSLLDMQKAWEALDNEVKNTPMPEEYKNFYVLVLCKDCHKESKVLFHVMYLKCKECGSYNTCRTEDRDNKNANNTPDIPPEGANSENNKEERS